ncbi:MAG: DIL domain-containing protein [Benjaminiella poitrasii]|nr:MAG: DIL domain-containing protein [Benjaminiella poitrasii]
MYQHLTTTLDIDKLSIDENANRKGKNKQNTLSWSSASSLFSNSTMMSSTTSQEEEDDDDEDGQLTLSFYYQCLLSDFFSLDGDDEKEKRLGKILSRSASQGDLQTIKHIVMDERLRPYLNLDASDDENDGSTPLIYASCFGKLETVEYLLQIGAKVDVQDKIGWTALMWATTKGHSDIVQLLLDHSASSETKSASGRTIYDLVDTDDEHIMSLLNDKCDKIKERKSNKRKSILLLHADGLKPNIDNSNESKEEQELQEYEALFRSVHHFSWDQCLPDQMFVFAEEDIDHILSIAVSDMNLPLNSKSEIYVPANIIFLSARYAHYYTNRELVHQLLSKAMDRISHVVKSNENDIHILALWIANLSQLLFYLKKDSGLMIVTAEYQLEISELVSETYTLLVTDCGKRIDCILEPSMLEFEQIDGLEAIEFVDDWHRFFRRNRFSFSSASNRRSFCSNANAPCTLEYSQHQSIRATLSPHSITSLLTPTLYVLQSYDVHPVIVIQAIAQIFHFLSCEIFNRILSNKKHLSRSRAIQIRMNLTVIEEWIREHQLPMALAAYFKPVIQLVQLLQCVSQLTELIDFISTVKTFDLLNPMQVRRLVLNYRYEVSESRLPEEIEKYTMQMAEDTLRNMQAERQDERKASVELSGITNSRPSSVSSLGSLLIHSMSQQQKHTMMLSSQAQDRWSTQSIDYHDEDTVSYMGSNNEDMDDIVGREWVSEKRDSKYMLPFSLPTITNMVHAGWSNSNGKENQTTYESQKLLVDQDNSSLSDAIYYEMKQKMKAAREKNARERSVIPSIPEKWLQRLDQSNTQE